jgi:hypothetical protein
MRRSAKEKPPGAVRAGRRSSSGPNLLYWSAIVSSCIDWRSNILVERDLFGKPLSTLGSTPRAGIFRIMLWDALNPPADPA